MERTVKLELKARSKNMLLAVVLAIAAGSWLGASAAPLARVSVDSDGNQADGHSLSRPAVSADGRYVAFSSAAANLVVGDTNGFDDVFVHDRQTGVTERVSLAHDGAEGNGWSRNPAISADGRYVAFVSVADNLVPGDTNQAWDVFVRDRQAGTTERVSLAYDGSEAQHGYLWHEVTMREVPMTDDPQLYPPAMSADGRYVAFVSEAANLVLGDTNSKFDVFLRDRQAGTTERVSVATGGGEADGGSHQAAISPDGRFLVFNSGAANLVAGDNNGRWDTFLRDRQTGTTERISVATGGGEADGESVGVPAVSANGRYVVFTSHATNLVVGDTNGQPDVFLRDRQAGTTVRISLRSNGMQANGGAFHPAISADGRLVAFASNARNTVPGIASGSSNIFLVDRQLGTLSCLSVDDRLKPSHGRSQLPAIATGGTAVTFTSEADDLVDGDTNDCFDVFCYSSGGAESFSLALQAEPAAGGSVAPANPVSASSWETVSIAADPAPGYEFSGWTLVSGDATIAAADALTTTVILAADSILAANFTPHRYRVEFALAPVPANSSLTGSAVQTVVHGGATTPVTAVAPEGYRFVKWTTGAGADFGTANPIALENVQSAVSLVANFAPEHLRYHQVSFIAEAHGNIIGQAVQVVAHGADCAPVTAAPEPGFQFVKWTRDGKDLAVTAVLSPTSVTADLEFVAHFAPEGETYYQVSFAAGAGGSLVGDVLQVVKSGENCAPVTAVPDGEQQFIKWTSGGATVALAATVVYGPVAGNAEVLANFAAAGQWWRVRYEVDGPGALAGEKLQVVLDGEATTAVTALADAGCLFRGWTGDFFGMVNPLQVLKVKRNLVITARFLDPDQALSLAKGSLIEVGAMEAGLDMFNVRPKLTGRYYRPFGPGLQTRQQQTVARIANRQFPVGTVVAEWVRNIRLFDKKAFDRSQGMNVSAVEWLGYDGVQAPLPLDLWLFSAETEPLDSLLQVAVLRPPAFTAPAVVADGMIELTGQWFGIAAPKVWFEAIGPDGKLRRLKLRVMPADDPNLLDRRGKPAFMNAADGRSRVRAIIPKSFPGGLTPAAVQAVVLDNGTGLAAQAVSLE